MSEHKTYPVKAPFEILEAVLRRVDPKYAFFGVALTELLDPSVPLDRVPNELKIRLITPKYNRLLHILEDVSFLRSSLTREGYEKGSSYVTSTLELVISGTPFNLEILACNRANMFEWCDFTFNNLLMTAGSSGITSRNGDRGSLSLRVEDPTKKLGSAQFLGVCIRDIISHRLVPMCPDDYLILTEETSPELRRHHVSMISTAIRMMEKGWTLCPSLTGKTLEFTLYTSGSSHDVCSICLESLGEKRDEGEKKEEEKEEEKEEANAGLPRTPVPRTTLPIVECKATHSKSTNQKAVVLACGHAFHIDCITRLMCEDGPTSYRCPLCKQHINFDTKHPAPPQPPQRHHSPHRRGPRRRQGSSEDSGNRSPVQLGRRPIGPGDVDGSSAPHLGPANIRRVLTNDYRAERLLRHNRHHHDDSSSSSVDPLGVASDEDEEDMDE